MGNFALYTSSVRNRAPDRTLSPYDSLQPDFSCPLERPPYLPRWLCCQTAVLQVTHILSLFVTAIEGYIIFITNLHEETQETIACLTPPHLKVHASEPPDYLWLSRARSSAELLQKAVRVTKSSPPHRRMTYTTSSATLVRSRTFI